VTLELFAQSAAGWWQQRTLCQQTDPDLLANQTSDSMHCRTQLGSLVAKGITVI
jgi:hypothetical protein